MMALRKACAACCACASVASGQTASLCVLSMLAGTAIGQTDFMGLGVPAGATPGSRATAVSGDGSTVVGNDYDNSTGLSSAFRWSEAGGKTHLALPSGGWTTSTAIGASLDGTIVGGGLQGPGVNPAAFRWAVPGVCEVAPYGYPAIAISQDGSSLVVGSPSSGWIVWRPNGADQDLGTPFGATAVGISPDGILVAVNWWHQDTQGLHTRAMLVDGVSPWIELGQWLPDPSQWQTGFFLVGYSADGQSVFGRAVWPSAPAIWRRNSVTTLRGPSAFAQSGTIMCLSKDGSRALGLIDGISGSAFWDATNGWRPFSCVIASAGASLAGWSSLTATGISNDGTVIVGYGSHEGHEEAWVARLPVIPNSADFNRDGFVSGDDFDQFTALFEAGSTRADFDGNGFVNGDDFDAFASAFKEGC